MAIYNSIPHALNYKSLVERNAGIINHIQKSKKRLGLEGSYNYLKNRIHTVMIDNLNSGILDNPIVEYDARLVDKLSEQRIIRLLEGLGYEVESGNTEEFEKRYIEVFYKNV